MRSKGDIDVSYIASKFGGGGHKNAAGLSLEIQDISLAKIEVLAVIQNHI